MFELFFKKYSEYNVIDKPNQGLVEKYKNKLPSELLSFWTEYGFGIYMDGFIKIINPDDYQTLLNNVYENTGNKEIVFAITGLGDFLLWTGDAIRIINFRYGSYKIIETSNDMTWFFDMDLTEKGYMTTNFKNENYCSVKDKLGELAFDECFGYEPILAAGGFEKVENLKKVKLIEHIELITQFTGKI